jgi:hypothetical protein
MILLKSSNLEFAKLWSYGYYHRTWLAIFKGFPSWSGSFTASTHVFCDAKAYNPQQHLQEVDALCRSHGRDVHYLWCLFVVSVSFYSRDILKLFISNFHLVNELMEEDWLGWSHECLCCHPKSGCLDADVITSIKIPEILPIVCVCFVPCVISSPGCWWFFCQLTNWILR